MSTKPRASTTPPSPQHLPLSAFSESFRPLGNRVALRRHHKDERAAPGSLLFRPEQKLKNSDRADVLAVGPDCKLGLRPGHVVVITRFSDTDRIYDGERLLILKETEVMGVMEA